MKPKQNSFETFVTLFVSVSFQCVDSFTQAYARLQTRSLVFSTLYVPNSIYETNERTDGQTHRRQESNLVHFSLKMLHLVAIFLF